MESTPRERYPAPYAFVSLPQQKQMEKVAGNYGHERARHYSGLITGTYTAIGPLRIGTGLYELGDPEPAPLYQPMFRVNGTPTIPGASLKGAVRSVVEAITCSCLLGLKDKRNPLRQCGSLKEDLDHNGHPLKLCPACRLFGSQGFRGLVSISDAPLSNIDKIGSTELPELYAPHPEIQEIYGTKARPRGRKFYRHAFLEKGTMASEVCDAGSVFQAQVSFEGLHEGEVGLLLLALGVPRPGQTRGLALKLGGNKPSGGGSVVFRLELLQAHRGADRWKQAEWTLPKEEQSCPPETFWGAAESMLAADKDSNGRNPYEQLRAILCPKRDELRLGGYAPKEGR